MTKAKSVLISISLIIALLFILTSCAGKNSSEIKYMSKTVNKLASAEFSGRLTGTEGGIKAGDYLLEEFKSIGLEPFFGDAYTQEFELEIYNPDRQKLELTVNYANGTKRSYEHGKDYTLRVPSKKYIGTFNLTFDKSDKELYSKAVILDNLAERNDLTVSPKVFFVSGEELYQNIYKVGYETPIVQISRERYEEIIKYGSKSIDISIEYTPEKATGRNILGKIKGKDSDKLVIITAHYDGLGWMNKEYIGCEADNASGTALLLNLARKFKKQSLSEAFEADLVFCAFDAGKSGYLGSKQFVELLNRDYKSIYCIIIDTIGLKGDAELVVDDLVVAEEDFTASLFTALDSSKIKFRREAAQTSGDHKEFIAKGISYISLTQEADYGFQYNKIITKEVDCRYLSKLSDVIFDFILGSNHSIAVISKPVYGDARINVIDEERNRRIQVFIDNTSRKLKFDETIIAEFEGEFIEINGRHALESIQEVNKYYPDMHIDEKILNYSFMSAFITDSFQAKYGHIHSVPKEQLNVISKRKLSADNISSMSLTYQTSEEMAGISIEKNLYDKIGDMTKYYEVEVLEQNDKKLYILYSKENKDIFRIVYELNIENKTYRLSVAAYNKKLTLGLDKASLIEIINSIDAVKLIKDLGI